MSRTPESMLLQGNEACADGALAAGCRFFAGYPITPSSEIAEVMAYRLPQVGGVFIQMEDEIASISAIIGGSLAGAKSMTATSGPGFSLMVEGLGFACMAEVPCVIVNVQRGGPSTGLPTKPAQADMMQARWGTHGDHPAIAVCPASVQESFDLTVKAFNLSEMYRLPVIVLLDEIVGHMREKMRPLTPEELEVYDRRSPSLSPKEYLHYGPGTNFLGPIASFGEGYRFHVTGLTHDETGFPTNDPEQIAAKMERLRQKIENNRRALQDVVEESMEDAEVALFAYGAVARSAKYALREARQRGVRVGLFRPRVIWPFPEEAVRGMLERVKRVIVPEMNQGQMVLEVERVNQGRTEVVSVQRVDGEIIDPREILARIPGL